METEVVFIPPISILNTSLADNLHQLAHILSQITSQVVSQRVTREDVAITITLSRASKATCFITHLRPLLFWFNLLTIVGGGRAFTLIDAIGPPSTELLILSFHGSTKSRFGIFILARLLYRHNYYAPFFLASTP
jgi:hypothetical protein